MELARQRQDDMLREARNEALVRQSYKDAGQRRSPIAGALLVIADLIIDLGCFLIRRYSKPVQEMADLPYPEPCEC